MENRVWHILTGDALREKFEGAGIEGEIIVSREALIDGPLDGNELGIFWQTRAGYIKSAYGEEESVYYNRVAQEYEKLLRLSQNAEVYLWFEFDLFCQVNMWFCLQLLSQNPNKITVYRVMPGVRNENQLWHGFGWAESDDLKQYFKNRVKFTGEEINLGASLWRAYQKEDVKKLVQLSYTPNVCFPYLSDVCWAEAERTLGNRPQNRLKEIINRGTLNFRDIFMEFSKTEGIYGFGDAQVKIMLDNTEI